MYILKIQKIYIYYWTEQLVYNGRFQSDPKIQTAKEAMVQLYHSRDLRSAGAQIKTQGQGFCTYFLLPREKHPTEKSPDFHEEHRLAITSVLAECWGTNVQTNPRTGILQAFANHRINFQGMPHSSSQHFLLVFKATTQKGPHLSRFVLQLPAVRSKKHRWFTRLGP